MNRPDIEKYLIPFEHDFVQGYIECAKWASKEHEIEEWDNLDFDEESLCALWIDAHCMYKRIACYLDVLPVPSGGYSLEELAGHDFFLTRNGHGTGYWDKKDIYGYYSKMFTKIAESFGECCMLPDADVDPKYLVIC